MDIGSGPNQMQVSLIVFSRHVYPRFDLNTYTNKTAMITAVNQTPFPGLSTNTDKALKYVRETSLTQQKGDRAGAHNVVIVMTDGISNNPSATENEANLLKKLPDTTVIAIGIAGADKNEVAKIATDPTNCKLLANFDDLDGFVTELNEMACSPNSGSCMYRRWTKVFVTFENSKNSIDFNVFSFFMFTRNIILPLLVNIYSFMILVPFESLMN